MDPRTVAHDSQFIKQNESADKSARIDKSKSMGDISSVNDNI